jgi:hypothetical protein
MRVRLVAPDVSQPASEPHRGSDILTSPCHAALVDGRKQSAACCCCCCCKSDSVPEAVCSTALGCGRLARTIGARDLPAAAAAVFFFLQRGRTHALLVRCRRPKRADNGEPKPPFQPRTPRSRTVHVHSSPQSLYIDASRVHRSGARCSIAGARSGRQQRSQHLTVQLANPPTALARGWKGAEANGRCRRRRRRRRRRSACVHASGLLPWPCLVLFLGARQPAALSRRDKTRSCQGGGSELSGSSEVRVVVVSPLAPLDQVSRPMGRGGGVSPSPTG